MIRWRQICLIGSNTECADSHRAIPTGAHLWDIGTVHGGYCARLIDAYSAAAGVVIGHGHSAGCAVMI